MRERRLFIGVFLYTLIGLSGCNPRVDPAPFYTQAAQTIEARLTQTAENAPSTPTHFPTPISPVSLPTIITVVVPPSSPTPAPPTNTPVSSLTPSPTETPSPTFTLSPTTIPCNWLQLVSHVTIKEGTIFAPGTEFVKVWRIRNIGSCSWSRDYDLVYVDGTRMGGERDVSLAANVLPGQTIDVSISLESPSRPGDYTGEWMLRSANGVLFGEGDDAEDPFDVSIRVIQTNRNYLYDFALNICNADWSSGTGELSCPGVSGSRSGFVILLDEPELENRREDEPALWVHPNFSNSGWISGVYPPIKVEEGDYFRAWIGCLEGSRRCDLIFQLDYQIEDGPIHNLGQWSEEHDDEVTVINRDLSEISGDSVQFILNVFVNGGDPEDANGFWFVPRIER